MPILDLQRRLHEAGRIRIGHQVPMSNGRSRPERLSKFRFTSSSKRALEAVAALHGGEVQRWDGAPVGEQFEVYTEATEIPVVVPPDEMGWSQHYELWTGGGCKRRCDGETEQLTDGPCLCDPEARECKPHSRLSVMLVGVGGVGLWRLDTQGFYAAVELQGAHDMARLLADALGRSVLPATLRVEPRSVKRSDKTDPTKITTKNFIVPVLDYDVDVSAIALGAATSQQALAAPSVPRIGAPVEQLAEPPAEGRGITPIPAATPSIAEQLAQAEHQEPPARRKNSAPPLPRTGVQPRTVGQAPEPETSASSTANEGEKPEEQTEQPDDRKPVMLRRLHMVFGEINVKSREERLAIAREIVKRAGIESSNDLTVAEIAAVLNTLSDRSRPQAQLPT